MSSRSVVDFTPLEEPIDFDLSISYESQDDSCSVDVRSLKFPSDEDFNVPKSVNNDKSVPLDQVIRCREPKLKSFEICIDHNIEALMERRSKPSLTPRHNLRNLPLKAHH